MPRQTPACAIPALQPLPQARFGFTGEIGRRLHAVTEQWILPAPLANPAMLEMFRNRDRKPYQEQMPWAGEFAGKYLTHATQIYRLTRARQLRTHLDWFVGELVALQAEDGYLGPWPKPWRLRQGIPGSRQPWDAWGHYHIMTGLLLWHETTGDKRALTCAARIGDLFCNRFLGDKPEKLHDTGCHEMNQAPVHSLTLLYRVTGRRRYLEMAQQIVAEFAIPPAGDYLRSALAGKEFWEMLKPRWESLHPIMGLAELYYVTGEESYRQAFENLWWSMCKGDRHNNGGFTSGEQATGNPYDRGPIETCCTIAWMAMSVEMLRLTGNPIVADELELSLYNSGLGMMSPSGRWVTYNTPMDGVRRASAHDIVFQAKPGSPELNCCSVNGPRALGLLTDWAVMGRPDGIALNYYGPGTLETPAARLVQTTDYPRDGRVVITVTPRQTAEFTIALRIPHWSEQTIVSVNGRRVPGVTAGRYLDLRRRWRRGDRIAVRFDFRPHFWAGESSRGALDLERSWSLFGPVPRSAEGSNPDQSPPFDVTPALEGLTNIPAALTINGTVCQPTVVTNPKGVMACRELFPAVGGLPVTVGFAEWESATAETMTLWFAADWWIAWYVNGEKVFDNFERGNGGDLTVRNNRCEVRLRPGRNVIAFKLAGGKARGCWLSLGREMTAEERARERAQRGLIHATSIYRGPVLLAYDPRYNQSDYEEFPVLRGAELKLKPATDPTWLKPWMLFEVRTRDGRKLRLCDFGSAGAAGNTYKSWLPVESSPGASREFSRAAPLRSFRSPAAE